MVPSPVRQRSSVDQPVVGRFAPSPTGELHLGNLRTAVAAWLLARHNDGRFLLRIDDLDQAAARREIELRQLADLAALGIEWDEEPSRQSDHDELYRDARRQLETAGLVYPCYCSRREIREAQSAPHVATRYPGTCRRLTATQRSEREQTRPAALRFRSSGTLVSFVDEIAGQYEEVTDDVVIWRNGGGAAYNLAVVIDDDRAGVTQVARGDDLLSSTPAQIELCRALGIPAPTYAHVPLVFGPTGERLAKRDGAVSLTELGADGMTPERVLAWIGSSMNLCTMDEDVTLRELLQRGTPTWRTWYPLGGGSPDG